MIIFLSFRFEKRYWGCFKIFGRLTFNVTSKWRQSSRVNPSNLDRVFCTTYSLRVIRVILFYYQNFVIIVIVFPGKKMYKRKGIWNWKYGTKYFHYFACKKKWKKRKMFLFLRKSKLNIYIYTCKESIVIYEFSNSPVWRTNFETKEKFILHFFLSLYVK